MKKQSLLLVIFLTVYTLVNAQEYSIGLKGGINFSTIGDLFDRETQILYTSDKEMGTQFGLFLMIDYGKFFIRPEANYTSLKNTYPLTKRTSNWTATKIDIPIHLGYRIYGPVALYAGPSFSSISKVELEGLQYKPLKYIETSMNIEAGIFFEFDKIGLDLRYQYGITKVDLEPIDIDKGTFGTNVADLQEYNPSQIMLSIHIKIADFSNIKQNKRVKKGWRNHKNL